jgi:restriction endonuclease S subunit
VLENSDLSKTITGAAQPQITRASLSPFKIPLPPLEIQEQIVDELENYQKVIDGARASLKAGNQVLKLTRNGKL